MNSFKNDNQAILLLFNLKNDDPKRDSHWGAAVEIFMERSLPPKIQSKRSG